jgi:hypothetical protein
MSLENKLRKPTQGQMPAAVVDELGVQPPQEPDNVADDHWEQIIDNLSDEDIPLPTAPQITGQIPQSLQLHLHLREKDRSTMNYKTSKLQRQSNRNQRLL